MIRFRKGWVLLAVMCVALTLWAWDMVRDFRSFASGGPVVDAPATNADD